MINNSGGTKNTCPQFEYHATDWLALPRKKMGQQMG
jgi:hypothetical protein